MKVTVQKITDEELMKEACNFTMGHRLESKMSLEKIYQCKHSPLRTQLFIIRMYGIPSFVSTHLVRHSATGQLHYVGTNREDRGGSREADRYTPVDHMMILNAQHLIDMSHQRLCFQAHTDTTKVMMEIRNGISLVDIELSDKMVPKCIAHRGCDELVSCGYYIGGH